jgi:hypothetical protein
MGRTLTPEQCRAARRLLGWSGVRLAALADVSPSTVHALEAGVPPRPGRCLDAIRAALEAAAVEFVAGDGGAPEVRLRESSPRR